MLLKLCPIEWGFFMNIKFLVSVFIGIFFSCLGLSKLANFYFDISSDYLTATATFFAAFVALYLYSDWRDQFKTELFERLKDRLHVLFNNVTIEYDNLYFMVVALNSDLPDRNELIMQNNKYQYAIDALLTELDFYEKILNKYKPQNITVHTNPRSTKDFLTQSLYDLSPKYEIGGYAMYVNSIKQELLSNRIINKITGEKILINNDIQNIILKLINNKPKGQ